LFNPPPTVYILEAERQEQINRASGEAQAMLAIAEARAKGLELVARPLRTKVIIFTFPKP
jgi:regulator of protease activity HflC (stomatin/prohibitin superfamily)